LELLQFCDNVENKIIKYHRGHLQPKNWHGLLLHPKKIEIHHHQARLSINTDKDTKVNFKNRKNAKEGNNQAKKFSSPNGGESQMPAGMA
jgi:hypothetical protein